MTPIRWARRLAPVFVVALGATVFACSGDENHPTGPLATPSLPANGPTKAATKIAITTQPSSTVLSGSVLAQQPATQLRDASNNPVSKSGVLVTASIASGAGTLGGTKTATTNANGVATFSNLSVAGTAGTLTLSFSAPSIPSVKSNAITVGTGAATASTELAITTQPSPTVLSGSVLAQQPVDAVARLVEQSL